MEKLSFLSSATSPDGYSKIEAGSPRNDQKATQNVEKRAIRALFATLWCLGARSVHYLQHFAALMRDPYTIYSISDAHDRPTGRTSAGYADPALYSVRSATGVVTYSNQTVRAQSYSNNMKPRLTRVWGTEPPRIVYASRIPPRPPGGWRLGESTLRILKGQQEAHAAKVQTQRVNQKTKASNV